MGLSGLAIFLKNVLAGDKHLGEVGGQLTTVKVEFTRENNPTPYDVGDTVSASAGSPVVLEIPGLFRVAGGSGYITASAVTVNTQSVIPRFRIHFYNASNPTVSGDNLPHRELYADIAKRLKFLDCLAMGTGADVANSDMSRGMNITDRLPVIAAPASTSLWVELETLDAVTLTAQSKITVTLTLDNN